MASSDLAFDQSSGGLFIQPNGPGTPLYFLACHDAADLSAPGGGMEIELNRRIDGTGYDVISARYGQPEIVKTTITGLTKKSRDWLEKVICHDATLYFMQSACGKKDNPTNFERAYVVHHINIPSRTYSGLAHHLESAQSTHAFEIEAWPPLIEAVGAMPGRLSQPVALALNDIWTDTAGQCRGECGNGYNAGDIAGVAADSAVGPGTADILFASNGATFTAGAVDPLGAGFHAMAISAIAIGKSGYRWIVVQDAPAAAQGHVAYSDNSGAAWVTVNLGGAAVGHGAKYGGSLYTTSPSFCQLASAKGYIYKSTDGGATWTAKELGGITVSDYSAIHFSGDKYGCAVGATGIVTLSVNGGESWYAGTVIGGGTATLNCVRVLDNHRIIVGDASGKLWQSVDFGATWSRLAGWPGDGTGSVRGIDFAAQGFVGFMVVNSAAPVGTILRTIDGGANWVALDNQPLNSGYNAVKAIDANSAYVVGEATGGTGVLVKVTEA